MGVFNIIKKVFKIEKDNKTSNNNSIKSIQEDIFQKQNKENKQSNEEKQLSKNFTYLDQLIHNGQKEIILENNIILKSGEEKKYHKGILLDVDDIIIDGNGHKIDAQGLTRIFEIRGKNITIKNITLKNGYAYEGGAILNWEEIIITNTILQKNTAEKGGAIYNYGTINIQDTILYNNNAEEDGGAIYNKSNFKVFNSEISKNSSNDNIVSNENSLQIHNTIFKDNQSQKVIFNNSFEANMGIFYCKFKRNNIKNSIINNNGKYCIIENSLFDNNLHNNSKNIINTTNLRLKNIKITDKGKSILNNGHTMISSENYENTIEGEGIIGIDRIIPTEEHFDFRYLDKKIHESTTKEIILEEDISFGCNERDFYEGGIELDADDLIIDGKNHTIDAIYQSRIFIVSGKNITLKNITFKRGRSFQNSDNSFNQDGGAIKIKYNSNLIIKNCKFILNETDTYGGAISNQGALTIQNTELTQNISEMGGGAIANHNKGAITIQDTVLTKNTTNNKYGFGGAIYNEGPLIIQNSTLNNNISGKTGGAIWTTKNINIENCEMTNNKPEDIFKFQQSKKRRQYLKNNKI